MANSKINKMENSPIVIIVNNGTQILLSKKRSLGGIKEEASLEWGDGRVARIFCKLRGKALWNESEFQNWLSFMERNRKMSPILLVVFPGECYLVKTNAIPSDLAEETILVRWGKHVIESTKRSLADIQEEASLEWGNGQTIPHIKSHFNGIVYGNEGAFNYIFWKRFGARPNEKLSKKRPREVFADFPRDTYQRWQRDTLKANEQFTLDGFEEIRVKRGEEVMVTRFRLLKLIQKQAQVYWGGIDSLEIHIYSVASQAVIWNEIDFQSWLTNTWANCKTSELVAVFEGEKFHTRRGQQTILSPEEIIRVKHREEVMLSSRRSLADIQMDAALKWNELGIRRIPRIIINDESQREITNEFYFEEWLEDWKQNPTDLLAVFPHENYMWNCVTRLLSRVVSSFTNEKGKHE
ncbi:hypothetical protein HA402_015215 [Bradysia odoriphaga]|nr:hypothetical protein HA402_015215 [Bradysia odoriphaga]